MTTLAARPQTDNASAGLRAVQYEWAAFRTVRSNWVLIGAAILVQLLLTVFAHDSRDHGDVTFDKVISVAWIFGALVGALGVNAFGNEYRYRTITTTVLTARSRLRVLWAKVAVAALAAIATETVVISASWLVLAVFMGAAPTASVTLMMGTGAVIYTALMTLVGLALAVLMHGSVVPIAFLVVWPEVEMLLINRLDLPEWLLVVLQPFYSARQLISETPEWPHALPMLGLAAVLLSAAGVVLTRRDV